MAFIYIGYRIFLMHTLSINLSEKIERGGVILDVRTKREFKTGHIKGALNIPLSKLSTDSIPIAKNAVIITVCSHGLRSVKAVERLKERGYSNAFNGGAWSDLEQSIKK